MNLPCTEDQGEKWKEYDTELLVREEQDMQHGLICPPIQSVKYKLFTR